MVTTQLPVLLDRPRYSRSLRPSGCATPAWLFVSGEGGFLFRCLSFWPPVDIVGRKVGASLFDCTAVCCG